MARRIAVIDVGTVSVRMAVATAEGSRLSDVERASRICDLGEGVSASGRILHAAIERTASCVRDYLVRARELGAEVAACTLTSAARDAGNAIELLSELSALGLVPQVIPGDVEGSLAFLGAARDFEGERILVADSGGGSTEVALGRLGQGKLSLSFVRSVNVGCRRITERFLALHDPPLPDELERAHAACAASFAEVAAGDVERLVACGGTATSLVAMELALDPYDPARVHLHELGREQVAALEREMAMLTEAQRRVVTGLQPQRAPVILGGIVALGELMDAVGVESMTVTESDLLLGLAGVVGLVASGSPSPVGWEPALVRLG